MKTKIQGLAMSFIMAWLITPGLWAQKADSAWTLQKCIQYALQKNIQVRKSDLTNEINLISSNQVKQDRFPTLNASVNQNFSWGKQTNQSGTYGNFIGSNATNYSLSSTVTLFNGFRISNTIRESELSYEAGKYDSDATKESISLNILSAYLQVIYAEEQVANDKKQVESTGEQANYSEQQLSLGSIAQSDYLQVKSQLATEKQTLATDESTLAINRVTLMQLLEIPVTDTFRIYHPDFSHPLDLHKTPGADSIYRIALGIKPQIKSAQLNVENSKLGIKLAKAGYLPTLSLNAGVSSGYSSLNSLGSYDFQVKNEISPVIGLTLSIPIYQNSQTRSNVAIARINSDNAQLDEINVENQLRKSIEQATVDVVSAEKEYQATIEQYDAANESYKVALEKFRVGMINSVDFIVQKTNLIVAESKLLQSKYNLIFSYKTLDFYSGKPLTL